jgi:hypothetical protein
MDYTVQNKRQEVTWITQNQTHVKKLYGLYRTKHTLRSYMDYTVTNKR